MQILLTLVAANGDPAKSAVDADTIDVSIRTSASEIDWLGILEKEGPYWTAIAARDLQADGDHHISATTSFLDVAVDTLVRERAKSKEEAQQ